MARKVILLFIIIGFVLYANSFGNEMFWDDDDNILKNKFVQDWQYWPKYFSENLIAGAGLLSNYWRPVLLTVFSIEWHLWQDWAPGYHFVNTSFHIVDAILLFFILFYLFKNKWLAVLTSLVFLVHPLQAEAVSYVSGLGDPLSVFFIFLGILFYLKGAKLPILGAKLPAGSLAPRISSAAEKQGAKLLCWALLMYVLALMTKETAIVMPGLIFIIDFIVLKKKFKQTLKSIWPFLAIAGVYVLLRATALNFLNTFNLYNEENIFTSNFDVRLFTFLRILVIYFGLLFWPFGLHMERSVAIAFSLFSWDVILGALISLALLFLAFVYYRKLPIVSFGIFWFFIGLAPVSNLAVPVSGLLYEHWLYLPMIGVFLSLIWLGQTLGAKLPILGAKLSILGAKLPAGSLAPRISSAAEKQGAKLLKFGLAIFVGLFLIFLSVLTINRNRDWKDPITFYEQTLKYAPNSYRVINNLGMAYDEAGDYQKAEERYQKAISLAPQVPVAYHNLANTYKNMGKIDLAIENYQKAISLDPKFVFSYKALYHIYLEQKDEQKAKEIINELKALYHNSGF